MADALPIVNVNDLPLESMSRGTKFAVQYGEIGEALGFKGLGATLNVVQPGKSACPFHRHFAVDEMFLVLSGTGTYRLGDQKLPIKAGDCLGAPAAGSAHQIFNTGDEPLRYIALSNNTNADVVEYPDSGRVRIDVGPTGYHHTDGTFKQGGRLTPLDYWDGENTGEAE